jgi:hypothetical protein
MKRMIRSGPGGGMVELFSSQGSTLPASLFRDRRPPLGEPPPLRARVGATVGRGGGGHGGGGHGGHGGLGGRGGHWGPQGPWNWNRWGADDTLYYLPICPDGLIRLPDGSCVDAEALDFEARHGNLVVAGASPVPSGLPHRTRVGTILGPGGSQNPIGGGVYGTGTDPGSSGTGSPQADALNLQWQALNSVIPRDMGSTTVLPDSYITVLGSSDSGTYWSTDYADWTAFYSQVGTWEQEAAAAAGLITDLQGWQMWANAWGAYYQDKHPKATLPANWPSGGKPAASLPSLSSLANPLKSVLATAAWVAVAVVVGLGVWLLWPVFMHFRPS